ncbi:antitoxin HicB [Pseudomonas asturiensis]|uniref:Antitoxin HicB n=1 Tax=Pseudomonas asturiensis TaxID=1190415 RepID=A0A1M7IZM9_9PSED|nr:transcriptional regulator [Pseudomonas asturiensis]SHM46122.1 antitoxin HicB [Pseudomonas asturiensis]
MFDYPVTVHTEDTPGVALTCDTIPEFNAVGDDLAEALTEAGVLMPAALSIYVDQRRVIPHAPVPEDGQPVVRLSALAVAKIELWNTMMEKGLRKADLCRLLGVSQSQGDRLVDFMHGTKLEALEAALAVLGKRLKISVEAA